MARYDDSAHLFINLHVYLAFTYLENTMHYQQLLPTCIFTVAKKGSDYSLNRSSRSFADKVYLPKIQI
jgi:hypothetical protein